MEIWRDGARVGGSCITSIWVTKGGGRWKGVQAQIMVGEPRGKLQLRACRG